MVCWTFKTISVTHIQTVGKCYTKYMLWTIKCTLEQSKNMTGVNKIFLVSQSTKCMNTYNIYPNKQYIICSNNGYYVYWYNEHKKHGYTKIYPIKDLSYHTSQTPMNTTNLLQLKQMPTHIITTAQNILEYEGGTGAVNFTVCIINKKMCKQKCSAHWRQNTQL